MAIPTTRSLHLAWPRLALPRWPDFRAMRRAVETRRLLGQLDDRMLRDIGISRLDALEEARRVPWDLGPRR